MPPPPKPTTAPSSTAPTKNTSKPPSNTDPKDPTTTALLTAIRTTSTTQARTDFTQDDLLALAVPNASTVKTLIPPLTTLVNTHHLILLTSTLNGSPTTSYRLRNSFSSSALASLHPDHRTIYTAIESAGRTGLWTRTLQHRTSLHQTTITKGIKALQGMKLIKQMKSVLTPTRKIYILYHLEPPEEATGGCWFSEGELDSELVERLGEVVVWYVEGRSWRVGPKRIPLPDKTALAQGRAGDWGDERAFYPALSSHHETRRQPLLPHPPSYTDYPTAGEVLTYIESKSLVTAKDVSVGDLGVLMEVLVYDGKLERMGWRREEVEGQVDGEDRGGEGGGDGSGDEEGGSAGEEGDVVDSVEGDDVGADDHDDDEDDDDDPIPLAGTKRKNPNQGHPQRDPPGVRAAKNNHLTPAVKPTPKTHLVPTYRTTRKPYGEHPTTGPGSAFAETPCSQCPVFDLCEEGGPINAADCGYFGGWFGM